MATVRLAFSDAVVNGSSRQRKGAFLLPASLVAHHSAMLRDALSNEGEDFQEDEEGDAVQNSKGANNEPLCGCTTADDGEKNSAPLFCLLESICPSPTPHDETGDDAHIDVPLSREAGHVQRDVVALFVVWCARYSAAGVGPSASKPCSLYAALLGSGEQTGESGQPSPLLLPPFLKLAQAVEPPSLPPNAPRLASVPDPFTATARSYFARALGNQWEADFLVDAVLFGGGGGEAALLGGTAGESELEDDNAGINTDKTNKRSEPLLADLLLPLAAEGGIAATAEFSSPSNVAMAPSLVRRFHRRLYFLSSLALFLDASRLHGMASMATAALLIATMRLTTAANSSNAMGGAAAIGGGGGDDDTDCAAVFLVGSKTIPTPAPTRKAVGFCIDLSTSGTAPPPPPSRAIVPHPQTLVEAARQTASPTTTTTATSASAAFARLSHMVSDRQMTYSRFSPANIHRDLLAPQDRPQSALRSSSNSSPQALAAAAAEEKATVLERQRALRGWFLVDGRRPEEGLSVPPLPDEGVGWLTAAEKAAIGERFAWCTSE